MFLSRNFIYAKNTFIFGVTLNHEQSIRLQIVSIDRVASMLYTQWLVYESSELPFSSERI